MTAAQLHLIKLSVGAANLESLREWQAQRLARHGRLWHATRMRPRRQEELLDPAAPGSIYWVIRGIIQVRQKLLAIETRPDEAGRNLTELLLDPELVPVEPRPARPFQGWRYLPVEKAPPDCEPGAGQEEDAPPPELLAELRSLGIL